MTVFSNLIGFSVGEINRIDRWKQYFCLKYFLNALKRKAALMTVPFADITKTYAICQNISVVFIVMNLVEKLSSRM